MGRDFFIAGECMVSVKGAADSYISQLTQLGLSSDPISVTFAHAHKEMKVDAWGGPGNGVGPPEIQFFGGDAQVQMTLIHYDHIILDACLLESRGIASQNFAGNTSRNGQIGRTGARMGNNKARFAAGNRFFSVNISSPVSGKPYRFWYCYMPMPPVIFPLGTEKTVAQVTFRAIPYTTDPWGDGDVNQASAQPYTTASTGSYQAVVFDNILDT